MASNQVPEIVLREIFQKQKDTRYKLDAYLFVMNGLEFYLTLLGEKRHVTGQELSKGLLLYAHKQFGALACSVLKDWGIRSAGDFGAIVYNLIDIKVLSKQPDDSIEDFHAAVDFTEFFATQDNFEIDRNFIKSIKGA